MESGPLLTIPLLEDRFLNIKGINMTTSKMLRLLDDEEVKRYEDLQRKEFNASSTHNLEVYFQLNRKLRQQVDIKLNILEEILSKRVPDNKLKQAKD